MKEVEQALRLTFAHMKQQNISLGYALTIVLDELGKAYGGRFHFPEMMPKIDPKNLN